MKSLPIKIQEIKKQYQIFPYKFKIEDGKYFVYLDNQLLETRLKQLEYDNLEHKTKYLTLSMKGSLTKSLSIVGGYPVITTIHNDTGEVSVTELKIKISGPDDIIMLMNL